MNGMNAPPSGMNALPASATNFEVELPAGGKLHLQTIEEVELWEVSRDRYLHDYRLTAQSDRLQIGNALILHLEQFRAQQRINGMQPELRNGVPTGRYVSTPIKAQDRSAALSTLIKTGEEIRDIEKSLGIDKRTRDQGGQYDVAAYVDTLKRAGRQYAVHLSRRYQKYEEVFRDLEVQVQMLDNLDQEDRQEHQVTPEAVLSGLRRAIAEVRDADVRYANEKGKLFLGKFR